MLSERNRWRKSCAFINLVSWLKLVKLRLNDLRLEPLNSTCHLWSRLLHGSNRKPRDVLRARDRQLTHTKQGSGVFQFSISTEKRRWDQPPFEDWEPLRSSRRPRGVSNPDCPSNHPSSFYLELRDIWALPSCPRANSRPSAPPCLTGTVNALSHSLPLPRVLLFIGCCRSRTTNQFQSLWQWGLTGLICLPWGQ